MPIRLTLALIFLTLLAVRAAAQSPPAAAASAPPPSGLGKQVTSTQPEVSIGKPAPREVVESAIQDIEHSQLSDEQFERIKRLYLRRERQRAMPYVEPAKPVVRTLHVNLDPGISPPVLRLTRGQLTSVVFSDVAGAPWMIQDVGLNRELFGDGHEGNASPGQGSEPTNVLTIEPKASAAYGSASIRLKGLATPVIFILAAGQQEVDLRVDAHVPGRNPDAVGTESFDGLPNIDESLVGFLDGVPPKEARAVHITGLPNTEGWVLQDRLYLRTDAAVEYPAYYSSVRSTSGKAVYRFNTREVSITLLANGRATTVFVTE